MFVHRRRLGVLHPAQWWGGEDPIQPDGGGYRNPISGAGTPPSPEGRAAQRVLATWKAVCLLHSHRRTFLLPPTYVVQGKVIFILGNVYLFTIGGGVSRSQVWGGYPGPRSVGYPISGVDGVGVPHPRSEWWGGTPSQVWMVGGVPRVTPHYDQMGYPPPP